MRHRTSFWAWRVRALPRSGRNAIVAARDPPIFSIISGSSRAPSFLRATSRPRSRQASQREISNFRDVAEPRGGSRARRSRRDFRRQLGQTSSPGNVWSANGRRTRARLAPREPEPPRVTSLARSPAATDDRRTRQLFAATRLAPFGVARGLRAATILARPAFTYGILGLK